MREGVQILSMLGMASYHDAEDDIGLSIVYLNVCNRQGVGKSNARDATIPQRSP